MYCKYIYGCNNNRFNKYVKNGFYTTNTTRIIDFIYKILINTDHQNIAQIQHGYIYTTVMRILTKYFKG